MSFKRILTWIVCVAVAVTSVAVPVTAAWKHIGYDITSLGEGKFAVGECFGEYVNGVRIRSEIRPTRQKWETEGCEAIYPHASYSRLYAFNSDTKVYEALEITTYNGTIADWAIRNVNYDWDYLDIIPTYKDCAECKANGRKCIHFDKWTATVWQRQQTNIPGKSWTFDFGNKFFGFSDALVHDIAIIEVPAVDANGLPTVQYKDYTIEVKPSYKTAFVANFDVATGKKVTVKENKDLVNAYNTVIGENWQAALNFKANYEGELNYVDLSKRDAATGRFVMSDADIAKLIYVVKTKFVEGPTFDAEGKINGTKVVDLAKELIADCKLMADKKWDAEYDAEFDYSDENYVASIDYAMPVIYVPADVTDISWTTPANESVAPFQYYQYLVVCGVPFDGSNGRPVITRYLGEYADPANNWKLDY